MNKKLVVIFLLALFLRVAYVTFYPQLPVGGDADSYLNLGTSLYEGKGYINNGIEVTRRSPGYPFFVALNFLLFGEDFFFVRLVQSLISALTVVLIYSLANHLFNKKTALLSSFLAIIYPAFTFYSGLLLTETLYTFLLLLSFYLLIKKQTVLPGFFLGFASLVRTETILIVLFTLFALFISSNNRKNTVKQGIILLFCVFLIITPWTIRNYTLYNQFFLINTQYGLDLMYTTKFYDFKTDIINLPSADESFNPVEKANYYSNLAKRLLLDDSLFYLKNSVRRFFKFWVGSHTEALNGFRKSFFQTIKDSDYYMFSSKMIFLLLNSFIVFFGILGLTKFLDYKKINRFEKALFISPVIAKVIIHTFTIGYTRFQIPIMPFVLIFAGYFLIRKRISLKKPILNQSKQSKQTVVPPNFFSFIK